MEATCPCARPALDWPSSVHPHSGLLGNPQLPGLTPGTVARLLFHVIRRLRKEDPLSQGKFKTSLGKITRPRLKQKPETNRDPNNLLASKGLPLPPFLVGPEPSHQARPARPPPRLSVFNPYRSPRACFLTFSPTLQKKRN